MSNARGWLGLALRAQQFKTSNHQLAARMLQDDMAAAAMRHETLQADLQSVASLWAHRRLASQLDAQSDTAFQRFHAHLQFDTGEALHSQLALQARLEHARDQLQCSFGTQQVLQRVSAHAALRARLAQQALERQGIGEAWLLGRLNTGREP